MKIALFELRQLVFEHFLFENNIKKLKNDFEELGIGVYENDLLGFKGSYLQGIYYLIDEILDGVRISGKRLTPFSRDFSSGKVPKYSANALSLGSIKANFIIPEVIGIVIAYANLYKKNVNKLPPQFKDFNKIVRSTVIKKDSPGVDEKFEDYFEFAQGGGGMGETALTDFVGFLNQFFGFHITEIGYIREMVDKVSSFIEENLDASEKQAEGEKDMLAPSLENKIHPGIHQVYHSDDWEVFFAYTMKGSIDFGVSEWCTGYKETNRNAYNTYQSLGKVLYYVRRKKEREVMFPSDERDWRANPKDYFSLCMNKKKGELEFDGMYGGSSVYANQTPVSTEHLKRLFGNEIDDITSAIYRHFNEVYLRKYAAAAESKSAGMYGEPGDPDYVDKEAIDAMARIPRVCKQVLRQLGGNKKLLHILHILNHPDIQTQVFEYICKDFVFKENPTIIQNEGEGFPDAPAFRLLKDKLPLYTDDHRAVDLANHVIPKYLNQLSMSEYLCIVAAEVHREIPMGVKYKMATKIIQKDHVYHCFKAGSSRVKIFENILEEGLESGFYKEVALLALAHEIHECHDYPSYYQRQFYRDYTYILKRSKRAGEILSMYEEGSLEGYLIPDISFPFTTNHKNPSEDYKKFRMLGKGGKYKFEHVFTRFFNSLYAGAKSLSTAAIDSNRRLPPEYFEIVKNATEKDLQRFLISLKDDRDLVNNSDERDTKLNKYKEAHRVQRARLHKITQEYGTLSNEMANAIDMTPYIKAIEELVNMPNQIGNFTYEQFRDINVTDVDFALKLLENPDMQLARYVQPLQFGYLSGTNKVEPPAVRAIHKILYSRSGTDHIVPRDIDIDLLCQILSKQPLYQPIVLSEIFKQLFQNHHLVKDKELVKRIYNAVKAGPNAEYLLPAIGSTFNEIQQILQRKYVKLTFNDFKDLGYMELLDYRKAQLIVFVPRFKSQNTKPFETYMNSTIRNWSHSFLGGIYNFVMNSVEAGEITTWDEARGIIAEMREKAHELNKDHEYYIHNVYKPGGSKENQEYRPNVSQYIEEIRTAIDYQLHPYSSVGKNSHVGLMQIVKNREEQEPE